MEVMVAWQPGDQQASDKQVNITKLTTKRNCGTDSLCMSLCLVI